MEHQLKLIIRLLAIMAKILAFGFHVGAARDETIADIERIRAEAEEPETK